MPLSYFLFGANVFATVASIASLDAVVARGDAGAAVVCCALIVLISCNAVALNPWKAE